MQHTTNYNLNKFDATDIIEDDSRLAFNNNFDIIDTALKEASENGGIAVQDTQPTNDVLAWIDSDALGADFCFVGDTAPATDGTVAVWVDTSEDEIPVQSGAGGVSYDNTVSGLTADNVQGAIDEITVYSTDETVVGTWVDGRPIYRKVVQSNAHITGNGTIAHNIQNLGTVVNFEGWYIKDGAYFTLPYCHSNTRYLIGVFINTTDINFRCGDLADFDASYFILEYTKTTD